MILNHDKKSLPLDNSSSRIILSESLWWSERTTLFVHSPANATWQLRFKRVFRAFYGSYFADFFQCQIYARNFFMVHDKIQLGHFYGSVLWRQLAWEFNFLYLNYIRTHCLILKVVKRFRPLKTSRLLLAIYCWLI